MRFLAFLDLFALPRFRRRAVPEYVSETREGMDNIADAIRTLAGAFCTIAAGAHSDCDARQRDMAGVFYRDAQARFADVLRKMDPKMQADLESYITGICKGKQKR